MDGIAAARTSQEEQCEGHVPHETPEKALAESMAVERRTGQPQEIYCCPWCWWWHTDCATDPERLRAGKERQRQDQIDVIARHQRLDARKREWKRRARAKQGRRRGPR